MFFVAFVFLHAIVRHVDDREGGGGRIDGCEAADGSWRMNASNWRKDGGGHSGLYAFTRGHV